MKSLEWKELYQYVKKEIMLYSDDLRLSKYFILRLKGLSEGKFISNNKVQSMGKYSFREILLCFRIHKQNILNTLSSIQIKDEQHRVNIIMLLIEKGINDVVLRVSNVEKTVNKIEDVEVNISELEYKPKTKSINKKLKHMW